MIRAVTAILLLLALAAWGAWQLLPQGAKDSVLETAAEIREKHDRAVMEQWQREGKIQILER